MDDLILSLKQKSMIEVKEDCVILIDTSGSMDEQFHGKQKLDIVKDTIPVLKSPYTSYALMSFSSFPVVHKSFTVKFNSIISICQGLRAGGNTNMDLGLRLAKDEFTINNRKKRIILLSDGEPTCSESSVIEETMKCRNRKIIIDTIAAGFSSPLLRIIAELTDGKYYECQDFDLEKVFRELKYEIRYITHDDSN